MSISESEIGERRHEVALPMHHIGIAVHSLEQTAPVYELMTGAQCSSVEHLESQGVRVQFVGVLELLEPTDADGTVARFLERRGPGLHHVAYRTPDIAAELERLAAQGFDLIDATARPGAHGHLVAFLHPKSTESVLVELVQLKEPP